MSVVRKKMKYQQKYDPLTVYRSAKKILLPLKCKFIVSCVFSRGASMCFLMFPPRSKYWMAVEVMISAKKILKTASSTPRSGKTVKENGFDTQAYLFG